MDKGRVEAITDGIIAIAATIMVLELGVPDEPTVAGLLNQWPVFFAYIISFFMIYITWNGHHKLFSQIETISSKGFLINGVWIFFLTLVPFSTAWVGSEPNETVPAVFYALNLLLWSMSFHWLHHRIRKENPSIEKDESMRTFDRSVIYVGYSLGLLVAFISPLANLFVIGITTLTLIIRIIVKRTR